MLSLGSVSLTSACCLFQHQIASNFYVTSSYKLNASINKPNEARLPSLNPNIHGACRRVRDDQNDDDTRTSAESSYTTQSWALHCTHSNNSCPSSAFDDRGAEICLACWRDRPFLDRTHLVFDKVIQMGGQEATRPDSDEDCIGIGEFPCYSHYAESLTRLKQVPIFKVLLRPGRDSNHVEPQPTRHEAIALPTRPHVQQIQNRVKCRH